MDSWDGECGVGGVIDFKLGHYQRFWVWVARIAVRHAYKRGRIPVGLPGHRDPDNKCREYFPVLKPSGKGPCESDGHYLCSECEWITQGRIDENNGVEELL